MENFENNRKRNYFFGKIQNGRQKCIFAVNMYACSINKTIPEIIVGLNCIKINIKVKENNAHISAKCK